jgi:hypothetical protein
MDINPYVMFRLADANTDLAIVIASPPPASPVDGVVSRCDFVGIEAT